MRRRIALLLTTAMAVVLAIGCSSGGSGGSGGPGTITLANNGGSILIESVTLGSNSAAGAGARFIKTSNPDPGDSASFGDGHCEGSSGPGPTITTTDADAGPSLTFVNGATTYTALKRTNSGIAYNFTITSALAPVASPSAWTVNAAGGADIAAGTLATVRVPAATTGFVAPSITAGSPATVTWNAGSGADTMIVILSPSAGSGGVTVTCAPADTGSFTIPAAVTTSAGTGASVRLVGADLGKVTINGRDVALEALRIP